MTRTFALLAATLLLLLAAPCMAAGIGDKLTVFTAQSMAGKSIKIEDLLDEGPVMLVFWASWCPNCAREMPRIQELLKTEPGRTLQVVGINVGHNESEVRARQFIRRTGMDFPVIYDLQSKITMQHKVFSVPTILIADRDGNVVFRQHFVPEAENLATLLP